MQTIFLILLLLLSLFLSLLVLVQRGKGGGLAGAFGGMGGQSAFGAKAGDLFTKITIGVAFVWIILCIAGVGCLKDPGSRMKENMGTKSVPIDIADKDGVGFMPQPVPKNGS